MKSESSTKRKTRFGGEYFRILLSLLWLRHHYKILGYFVLLDKSHPMYGEIQDGHECSPMRWDCSGDQKITVRLKSIADGLQTRLNFAEWNLRIGGDRPIGADTVEIWMLDADGRTPRRLYASVVDWSAVQRPKGEHHWLTQVSEE